MALNGGDVPAVAADGVTGTLNVVIPALTIGFVVVQVTVAETVLQIQPFETNDGGAVTPLGKVIVVVTVPVVEALPIFVTVTGILLTVFTTKGVIG